MTNLRRRLAPCAYLCGSFFAGALFLACGSSSRSTASTSIGTASRTSGGACTLAAKPSANCVTLPTVSRAYAPKHASEMTQRISATAKSRRPAVNAAPTTRSFSRKRP